MSFGKPGEFDLEDKVSRKEIEHIDMECPNGCLNPRGMREVAHHTGRGRVVELPYGEEVDVIEVTERFIECPTCGWVMDI